MVACVLTLRLSVVPYLTDIIEAIERVGEKAGTSTLEEFKADWEQQWIVQRGIEIVSEASRRLPEDLKTRPGYPLGKGRSHQQRHAPRIPPNLATTYLGDRPRSSATRGQGLPRGTSCGATAGARPRMLTRVDDRLPPCARRDAGRRPRPRSSVTADDDDGTVASAEAGIGDNRTASCQRMTAWAAASRPASSLSTATTSVWIPASTGKRARLPADRHAQTAPPIQSGTSCSESTDSMPSPTTRASDVGWQDVQAGAEFLIVA